MNDASMAISVVIRTRDSARTLERVILGLGLSALDEVIIVDSGSRDSTLDIGRKLGAVIVIAEGTFNYSRSLNLGFKAAKNPWVLAMSSHAIPCVPQFMEAHRAAIRQFPPDVGVGYAPSTISRKAPAEAASDGVRYYTKKDYHEPMAGQCGNSNTIYRRSAWEKLPFDETIRTAEDWLWMLEWLERGGRIARVLAPRTLNCNQGSLAYMFRKGYSDSRAQHRKEPGTDSRRRRPMRLYDLAGALKKLAWRTLSGDISMGNWLRFSAHAFGQFFGSRQEQNNSPN